MTDKDDLCGTIFCDLPGTNWDLHRTARRHKKQINPTGRRINEANLYSEATEVQRSSRLTFLVKCHSEPHARHDDP